jgi:hypothetical protein
MSKPLQLVEPRPSRATIKKLRDLLEAAERGELVGIALVEIYRKQYTVDAVGQADARPTMTRVMMEDLRDLLRDRGSPGRG